MRYTELRPDPQLLKPNYGGFKLSLDTVPVLRIELPATQRPHRVRPNPQRQYSYLHARLFGLHNHLVRDPWTAGCLYYVDVCGTVQRVRYQPSVGRLSACCPVYRMELPPPATDPSDPYNASLVFATDRLCLLADGHGTVSVLQTGDRTATATTWVAECVLSRADEEGTRLLPSAGSVLLDARLVQPEDSDDRVQLHCIALTVEHFPTKPSETVVHWFVLEQQRSQRQTATEGGASDGWIVRSGCQLRSGAFPRYCSLDYDCAGLLVASEKPFTFTEDTEYPIEPEPRAGTGEPEGAATDAFTDADASALIVWSQTPVDVRICCSKRDGISWQFEREVPPGGTFQLTANGKPVLSGSQLFAPINGTPTMSETDAALELVFEKAAKESLWPQLYEGGPEETIIATGSDDGRDELAPPAPCLDAMLEECDFGDAEGEEQFFTLERLDRRSHRVTDRASLGSQPPLFTMRMQADAPAAIAVRYHVDACVWQPIRPVAASSATGTGTWNLRHEGTLHTFGYVQASKRQQKYLATAPDLSYAIIAESERMVSIYRLNYSTSGVLRRRHGPQVSVGQQHLIFLEDTSEILGICCENEAIVLLLEGALVTLQLTIEE
uniref:NudC domain-containing protein 1 n=1 Tax=Anopheles triannulatus TaxID=58253 RepID=A0A2M4AEN3_9DIPT